jgi:hypothetical protein
MKRATMLQPLILERISDQPNANLVLAPPTTNFKSAKLLQIFSMCGILVLTTWRDRLSKDEKCIERDC